jgi:hypothetical protein
LHTTEEKSGLTLFNFQRSFRYGQAKPLCLEIKTYNINNAQPSTSVRQLKKIATFRKLGCCNETISNRPTAKTTGFQSSTNYSEPLAKAG